MHENCFGGQILPLYYTLVLYFLGVKWQTIVVTCALQCRTVNEPMQGLGAAEAETPLSDRRTPCNEN